MEALVCVPAEMALTFADPRPHKKTHTAYSRPENANRGGQPSTSSSYASGWEVIHTVSCFYFKLSFSHRQF